MGSPVFCILATYDLWVGPNQARREFTKSDRPLKNIMILPFLPNLLRAARMGGCVPWVSTLTLLN